MTHRHVARSWERKNVQWFFWRFYICFFCFFVLIFFAFLFFSFLLFFWWLTDKGHGLGKARICVRFSFFNFLLYCFLLFFCFYFGDSLASDKGGGLGKWVWGKQEYVAAFFANWHCDQMLYTLQKCDTVTELWPNATNTAVNATLWPNALNRRCMSVNVV